MGLSPHFSCVRATTETSKTCGWLESSEKKREMNQHLLCVRLENGSPCSMAKLEAFWLTNALDDFTTVEDKSVPRPPR